MYNVVKHLVRHPHENGDPFELEKDFFTGCFFHKCYTESQHNFARRAKMKGGDQCNMIKKISQSLTVATATFLPMLATAQSEKDPFGLDNTEVRGLGKGDLKSSISGVIEIVLGFLGIVAVIVVLYGGFRWLTAGGDTAKVKDAQAVLKNGIIGLVIVLCAYILVKFVFSSLLSVTGGSTN